MGDTARTEGPLDLWVLLPRAATAGLLGLTAWQAAWNGGNPGHPRGVAAWTFAFFGADARDRSAALYAVSNLASPLLLWTVEGYRQGNQGTLLSLYVDLTFLSVPLHEIVIILYCTTIKLTSGTPQPDPACLELQPNCSASRL